MTNDEFFVPEVPQEDYAGIRRLVEIPMKMGRGSRKRYRKDDSPIQSRQHQSTPCHQLANGSKSWFLHQVPSRIQEDVI
ncbi:hypothetical protein [Coleofasciculus chthonoplastes]|uniref:hypothetical protein n=1 Tax=Coleofasciculus TaxID=669368 RepID=UPI0032FF451C